MFDYTATVEILRMARRDDAKWSVISQTHTLALTLATSVAADVEVVSCAALLSNLSKSDNIEEDEQMLHRILSHQNASKEFIAKVIEIIRQLDDNSAMIDAEAFVIEDARKLGNLGYVGIAHSIANLDKRCPLMYNALNPNSLDSIIGVISKITRDTTQMHTDLGTKMLAERSRVNHDFVNGFKQEWNRQCLKQRYLVTLNNDITTAKIYTVNSMQQLKNHLDIGCDNYSIQQLDSLATIEL